MKPLDQDLRFAIDQAADWLSQADGLVVAAGAGLGVDSGLPDFRGNEGFWRAYPALGRAQVDFTEIANPQMFKREPRLAWGFYGHRLALYRSTRPHAGFEMLKLLSKSMRFGSFVTTSNVDGQFQMAGFSPSLMHERHGSIHMWQCSDPCSSELWPAETAEPQINVEGCQWEGPLPRCPRCGACARPNILMFNDGQWISHRTDQQEGRFRRWLNRLRRPTVVELGAGVHVPSVRRFSEFLVQARDATLIRINPGHPEVGAGRAVSLPVGALEGLQLIAAARGIR